MSDTTPRPEDENPPVPPVAGGAPQHPETPAPPAGPAGAAPPPPAGPYGAPPAGAYPPPPGAYPPPPGAYPPPAGGYGAPVAPQSPFAEAFSWGWKKFTENGGVFVGAALIWLVIVGVLELVILTIFGGVASFVPMYDDGTATGVDDFGFSVGLIAVSALSALLASLVQAVFVRVSLKTTRGERAKLADFFDFSNAGPIVIAVLLLAAINLVVSLVSWIPLLGWIVAIAVNIFVFFTLYFVIDKNVPAVEAVKASIALVRANLSTTILFLLISYAILFAGLLLCGVGLLVAVPVVLLSAAFLYRRLTGEAVAPVA